MLVRPATLKDLPAVEAVRVATWKAAYRGMIPDDHLDGLTVRPERVDWLRRRFVDAPEVQTLVAVDDDVVGMATAGPSREEDLPGAVELYALYVLPGHWGRGAGDLLMDACGPVQVLWVLEANQRARSFYERHGFHPDGRAKGLDFDSSVIEVRYVLG